MVYKLSVKFGECFNEDSLTTSKLFINMEFLLYNLPKITSYLFFHKFRGLA